ncbi:MAG: M23 family metallopeptidase [Mycetocola sp.]
MATSSDSARTQGSDDGTSVDPSAHTPLTRRQLRELRQAQEARSAEQSSAAAAVAPVPDRSDAVTAPTVTDGDPASSHPQTPALPSEISPHDAVHSLDTRPFETNPRVGVAPRSRAAAPAGPRSARGVDSVVQPVLPTRRRSHSAAGVSGGVSSGTVAKAKKSIKTSLIVGLAVPGLFATAALPAYALDGDGAVADARANLGSIAQSQSLSVSAQAAPVDLDGDEYGMSNSADEVAATAAGTGTYDSAAALEDYLNASDQGWWRPLPGPITSPYGPRNLICNSVGCSNSIHEGIDFGNDCGTPIRAVSDGKVTFVGNAGGFGNRVIIEHDDEDGQTLESVYGHILTGSTVVQIGDEVSGGEVIAEVGATGVVSGCHLDLKIMLDGETTDPDPFLVGKGVTV